MGFGQKLKYHRKKLGLLQKDLAKMVNVSPQVVSNWERGYTHPDYTDVTKLSDALDVSTDYLLGKSDDPRLSQEREMEVDAEAKELLKILDDLPPEKRKMYMEKIKAYVDGMTHADREDN